MRHVLFVDGQPELRGVVQRALAASGTYRVSCAGSGDQALPVLERDRPDLVVVDAAVPGLPGIELVAHATERGIPSIVTTAEQDIEARLSRLGWPYLRKPFTLDHLLAECDDTIAEARRNLRLIRTSLQRLARISGEVKDAVSTLRALRERVAATLAASRRLGRDGEELTDAGWSGRPDVLTACARAMIRRHGSRAAAMAQHLADAHRAIDAAEMAVFWNAVAQAVQRLSGGPRLH